MRAQGRRRWITALSAAVAVHAATLLALIASIPILHPPPDTRAVEVQLWPRVIRFKSQPPPRVGSASGRPSQAPRSAPSPIAALPAGPATSVPSAAPPGDDLSSVRAVLRGALGCAEHKLARLTEAERAKCAEKFAAGVDPNHPLPAPIAPEKRAWFDAIVRARQQPGRQPFFGCGVAFNGIKPVKPKKPPHSLQLGPLPCYLVPPKGSLTEDVDIETPSKHDPLVDPYDHPAPGYVGPPPPGPPGPS